MCSLKLNVDVCHVTVTIVFESQIKSHSLLIRHKIFVSMNEATQHGVRMFGINS